MTFQFYCHVHDYGWSIDEDGLDYGCPKCIGIDAGTCDNCAERCTNLRGDRDRAVFCCVCVFEIENHYMANAKDTYEPCELCAKREIKP